MCPVESSSHHLCRPGSVSCESVTAGGWLTFGQAWLLVTGQSAS